jgi:hypothetical protein
MANTLLIDPAAAPRLWPDVLAAARRADAALGDADGPPALARHLAAWFADDRSARLSLSYETGSRLRAALAEVLVVTATSGKVEGRTVEALSSVATELHSRPVDPFVACAAICPHGQCRWRVPVADHIRRGGQRQRWADANALPIPDRYAQFYEVGLDAADHLVDTVSGGSSATEAATEVALCFAQQQLTADPERSPLEVRYAIGEVLRAAFAPAEAVAGDGSPAATVEIG